MINKDYLINLAQQQMEDTDRFLVHLDVKPGNEIVVFIDSDTQVTIEHCIQLSRFIESSLDREEEDFELKVSSAGLGHPLSLHRQYVKNVDQLLKILKTDGSRLLGTLTEVQDDCIVIIPEKPRQKGRKKSAISEPPQTISFEEINEAYVEVSF